MTVAVPVNHLDRDLLAGCGLDEHRSLFTHFTFHGPFLSIARPPASCFILFSYF